MSLLAGMGFKTCKNKKCNKSFDPSGTNRVYCTEKCKRYAGAVKLSQKRTAARRLVRGRCLECGDLVEKRQGKPGPKPKWCSTICSKRHRTRRNMQRLRDEKKLIDLGWRQFEAFWAHPDPTEFSKLVTFKMAKRVAGLNKTPPAYHFSADGVTVWINGELGLLARFGRFGIDIHQPSEQQCTKGECLFCVHKQTDINDWWLFVRKLLELYGINLLHEKYMPKRFKRKDRTDVRKRRDRTHGTLRTYAGKGSSTDGGGARPDV